MLSCAAVPLKLTLAVPEPVGTRAPTSPCRLRVPADDESVSVRLPLPVTASASRRSWAGALAGRPQFKGSLSSGAACAPLLLTLALTATAPTVVTPWASTLNCKAPAPPVACNVPLASQPLISEAVPLSVKLVPVPWDRPKPAWAAHCRVVLPVLLSVRLTLSSSAKPLKVVLPKATATALPDVQTTSAGKFRPAPVAAVKAGCVGTSKSMLAAA